MGLLLLGLVWLLLFAWRGLAVNQRGLPPVKPHLEEVNRLFVGETRAFLEDLKEVGPFLPVDGLIVVVLPVEAWDLPWYGYDWIYDIVDGLVASPAFHLVFEPGAPINEAAVAEDKLDGAYLVTGAELPEAFARRAEELARRPHLTLYRIGR
ncbi:MAG: hypothetical protein H6807_07880 [Planctomycetes bacterium]|nr:hypothetical protein [Planctomycetota bacterium]